MPSVHDRGSLPMAGTAAFPMCSTSSAAAADPSLSTSSTVRPLSCVGGVSSGLGGRREIPAVIFDLPSSGSRRLPTRVSNFSIGSPCSGVARDSKWVCSAPSAAEVQLDAWDAHLDLRVESGSLRGSCFHTDGFQYLWKGVRATHGVKGFGKYYFQVKVSNTPEVVMPETSMRNSNICRVGVSQPLSSLFLGDSAESWGWGGTGKKSTDGVYESYGSPFGLYDVIGVIVDLDNLILSFSRNGEFVGTAFELPPHVRETGLLPHILVKNVDFSVTFTAPLETAEPRRRATGDDSWGYPPPSADIVPWQCAPVANLFLNPVEHPASLKECEFLMMAGLPAVGKTYWAERHMARYPAKNYVVLGTNALIDQMKVVGIRRQGNYAERWQELITTATPLFNRLVEMASRGEIQVPRNVILDQTNVYKGARRRKAAQFAPWGIRRAICLVTDSHTLEQRRDKQRKEENKHVPDSAIMNMKANFAMPRKEEGFDHVDFVEMPETDSFQQIRAYNEEGRRWIANHPQAAREAAPPKVPVERRTAEEIGDGWDGERIRVEGKKRRYYVDQGPPDPDVHRPASSSRQHWRGGQEYYGHDDASYSHHATAPPQRYNPGECAQAHYYSSQYSNEPSHLSPYPAQQPIQLPPQRREIDDRQFRLQPYQQLSTTYQSRHPTQAELYQQPCHPPQRQHMANGHYSTRPRRETHDPYSYSSPQQSLSNRNYSSPPAASHDPYSYSSPQQSLSNRHYSSRPAASHDPYSYSLPLLETRPNTSGRGSQSYGSLSRGHHPSRRQ
eukprot:GHVT01072990.1.p1 GENE.GHVT01072990.1~~GHVT01072990.1.p1  ORF type:complete len:785 (-),score=73.81 GHVT01072990.1:314-2668(-)